MHKIGGIFCTVRYESRLVHHIQIRRNCLYSYIRTSVGTSHKKSEELSVQIGTNFGWYFMYKVGGIICTVRYERRLVHHVQSRRNFLYSLVLTSVGTSCTKSEELSVQLATNVGTSRTKSEELSVQLCTNVRWYIMYKVGGIVCTVMYEHPLVHHIQSRRNCLYS